MVDSRVILDLESVGSQFGDGVYPCPLISRHFEKDQPVLSVPEPPGRTREQLKLTVAFSGYCLNRVGSAF